MTAAGMQSGSDPNDRPWIGAVLRYWFDELGEAHWFVKNHDVDAQIRERFLALHEQVVMHEGCGVTAPRALLAAIIVLDQFSRNLFRGAPRAYAADPIALRLARAVIEQGCDVDMSVQERLFCYLPFEHSEDREDQALSVSLVKKLGNRDWTRYALAHKAIIDRFGRFPHRNAVLNRQSSAAEIALLQDPMGSF